MLDSYSALSVRGYWCWIPKKVFLKVAARHFLFLLSQRLTLLPRMCRYRFICPA